jgi:predicted permease
VVAESALALMLLICGGLFLRSFHELQAVNPGFEPRGVMSATFALPPLLYPRGGTERGMFYRAVLQRLEGSPGVASAALAQPAPFIGGTNAGNFEIVGRVKDPGQPQPHGNERIVSPNYFTTLKIPLRGGRYFADSDTDKSEGVIIIDEVLARKYWPDEDPIGKYVDRVGKRRIVGIVGHVLHSSLLPDNGEGTYYVPLYQRGFIGGQIVARTSGDVNQVASAIREAVHNANPRIAVDQFMSMEEAVARSLAPRRFAMQLIGFFAITGLLLSALGLYGVISYSVTQRTREIGIRMALGAERFRVLRMILVHALRLAAAGAAIGLMASAAGVKLIQRELYGIQAFDPATIATAVAVLALAALVASYLPARRAVRVDPALALRPE